METGNKWKRVPWLCPLVKKTICLPIPLKLTNAKAKVYKIKSRFYERLCAFGQSPASLFLLFAGLMLSYCTGLLAPTPDWTDRWEKVVHLLFNSCKTKVFPRSLKHSFLKRCLEVIFLTVCNKPCIYVEVMLLLIDITLLFPFLSSFCTCD